MAAGLVWLSYAAQSVKEPEQVTLKLCAPKLAGLRVVEPFLKSQLISATLPGVAGAVRFVPRVRVEPGAILVVGST